MEYKPPLDGLHGPITVVAKEREDTYSKQSQNLQTWQYVVPYTSANVLAHAQMVSLGFFAVIMVGKSPETAVLRRLLKRYFPAEIPETFKVNQWKQSIHVKGKLTDAVILRRARTDDSNPWYGVEFLWNRKESLRPNARCHVKSIITTGTSPPQKYMFVYLVAPPYSALASKYNGLHRTNGHGYTRSAKSYRRTGESKSGYGTTGRSRSRSGGRGKNKNKNRSNNKSRSRGRSNTNNKSKSKSTDEGTYIYRCVSRSRRYFEGYYRIQRKHVLDCRTG